MRVAAGALIGALLVVAACSLMTPAQVEPAHQQVLSKLPADLPRAQPHAATILVLVPDASSIYDTTEMAYVQKPFQVEYFARNEWADKPAKMIHGLLVKTLRMTGHFKAVLTPGQESVHKYELRSELLALQQDFTSDKPTLHVAMRLQLVDTAGSKVVATRELSEDEPMSEKSPYAGVVAANEAVARMLGEAARFVVEKAS